MYFHRYTTDVLHNCMSDNVYTKDCESTPKSQTSSFLPLNPLKGTSQSADNWAFALLTKGTKD